MNVSINFGNFYILKYWISLCITATPNVSRNSIGSSFKIYHKLYVVPCSKLPLPHTNIMKFFVDFSSSFHGELVSFTAMLDGVILPSPNFHRSPISLWMNAKFLSSRRPHMHGPGEFFITYYSLPLPPLSLFFIMMGVWSSLAQSLLVLLFLFGTSFPQTTSFLFPSLCSQICLNVVIHWVFSYLKSLPHSMTFMITLPYSVVFFVIDVLCGFLHYIY